jgi:hypothetical protein
MTVGTDTYITSEQYQAWADARGIVPNFATLDADLILSADFINTYYTLKPGYALPSADLVKVDEMAKPAFKAMQMQQDGLLALDLAGLANGVLESESFNLQGTYSESNTYAAGTKPTFKPRVPELDLLMRIFVVFSGGLVRA